TPAASRSCLSCPLGLVDHLSGNAEAVDPDGNSAIDRDLRQHGADFVGCEAVGQGTAHVGLEFLHLAQRGDHAKVEDRALPWRQRRVAPGFAPAILTDDALEVAIEVVGAVEVAIDIGGAQHLAAHREAAVVHLLVHGHSSPGLRCMSSKAASNVATPAGANTT